MLNCSPRAYRYALRSVPILCVTGIAIATVGHFAGMSLVRKIGTGTLLCGFAVWFFAHGLFHLWSLVRTVRRAGFRTLADEPWSSAIFFLITVTALFFGGFLVWWAFSGKEFSE